MTGALAEADIFRPRKSAFSERWLLGWFVCVLLLATDYWLLGPALFVFLLGWRYLSRSGEPPVVAAAFSYQWVQITIALFYLAITGRQIFEMKSVDYQPMVLIALASIVCLFGAYAMVSGAYRERRPDPPRVTGRRLSSMAITVGYVVTIAASIMLLRIAWSFPSVTQFLFILSYARYALLYMLMIRILTPEPRWTLVLLVLAVEIIIGFSGYFASFREPLVFVGLAVIVSGRSQRLGGRVAMAALISIAFATALAWTAIKPVLRKQYTYASGTVEQLQRVSNALVPALKNPTIPWSSQVDRLVARLWQLEYPSLAYERVPSQVPFENGHIFKAAVSNILMPRVFFPNKGTLESTSELVRKYSGRRVAGRESNTNIAFGYVAESYVDFGWPVMLVPILAFGCLVGLADRLLNRLLWNEDVLQSVRVVVLWSSMCLFETSWVIMIGTFVSLMVVLLGAGMLFERIANLSRRGSAKVIAHPELATH